MLTLRSIRALVVSTFVGGVILAAATTASADGTDGVACRTRSGGSSTELVLHWSGTTAKGTLQRTAQSGNVTTLNVRAERHDGMIIADDIYEKDLVTHAAVITIKNGKRYMRTEAAWLACE